MRNGRVFASKPRRRLTSKRAEKGRVQPAISFRDVECREPEGTWRPMLFEALRPGDVFRYVDDREKGWLVDSEPRPCDPPGNYMIDRCYAVEVE